MPVCIDQSMIILPVGKNIDTNVGLLGPVCKSAKQVCSSWQNSPAMYVTAANDAKKLAQELFLYVGNLHTAPVLWPGCCGYDDHMWLKIVYPLFY